MWSDYDLMMIVLWYYLFVDHVMSTWLEQVAAFVVMVGVYNVCEKHVSCPFNHLCDVPKSFSWDVSCCIAMYCYQPVSTTRRKMRPLFNCDCFGTRNSLLGRAAIDSSDVAWLCLIMQIQSTDKHCWFKSNAKIQCECWILKYIESLAVMIGLLILLMALI